MPVSEEMAYYQQLARAGYVQKDVDNELIASGWDAPFVPTDAGGSPVIFGDE